MVPEGAWRGDKVLSWLADVVLKLAEEGPVGLAPLHR
jgi:hypothetical protein